MIKFFLFVFCESKTDMAKCTRQNHNLKNTETQLPTKAIFLYP